MTVCRWRRPSADYEVSVEVLLAENVSTTGVVAVWLAHVAVGWCHGVVLFLKALWISRFKLSRLLPNQESKDSEANFSDGNHSIQIKCESPSEDQTFEVHGH
jgi:hypothetical protein